MKRYAALLACAFALSACGNQSSSDESANDQSSDDQATSQQASSEQAGGNQSGDEQSGNEQSSEANGSDGAAADSNDSGFANKNAKRSYALGMDIGNSLKDLPIDIDLDQLNQGVKDVVNDDKTKLTKQELQSVMQNVVSDMEAAQKQKQEKQSKANLDKGKQFLSENKSKDGVKTLDDGLQYKVMQPGKGDSPDANDSVTVDYTGKLIDGTVFDSSEKRGKPVTFPVNAVIPGWTEALQVMKPGGKYRLFIPPELAYGERGAGSQIGPNETLIFDVKLVSVDQNKGTGADSGAAADDSGSDDQAGQSQTDQSNQAEQSQSEDSSQVDQTDQSQAGQDQSGDSQTDQAGQNQNGNGQMNQSGQSQNANQAGQSENSDESATAQ